MAAYDVSVKMGLVDNVSKRLTTITKAMDKATNSARAYNKVVQSLAKSTNTLGSRSRTAATYMERLATSMDKMGRASTHIENTRLRMDRTKESIGKTVSAQKKLNEEVRNFRDASQASTRYRRDINALRTDLNGAVTQQKALNKATRDTDTSTRGLISSVKGLIGAYAGFELGRTVVQWSDDLTLASAKLGQITDDVKGLSDEIYRMSQNTRSDYMSNMGQIGKMAVNTNFGQAGSVFANEDELIQFNELLNKTFILGGTGLREMNASVYQLTQALSSGRLQGDELRSLAENAPMFINSITRYIEEMYNAGKSVDEQVTLAYGDLRELGAQGVITSDIIKQALLGMSDEIRTAFDKIPLTWEQMKTKLVNQMKKISEPLLETLNDVFNSESFEKMTQTLMKLFSVTLAILTPILKLVMEIGAFIGDNWTIFEPIIWGIVGALAVYYGWMMMVKLATYAVTVATTLYHGIVKAGTVLFAGLKFILAILTGVKYADAGATMVQTLATVGLTSATWLLLAPLLAVIAVIGIVIGAIYLVVAAYNKWTGSTLSATGIIVGAFYALYAGIYNALAFVWNLIVEVAEFIANVFNDPVYHVKNIFGEMGKGVLNVWKAVASGINKLVSVILKAMSSLVNGGIDLLNGLVDAYNGSLGAVFGKVDKLQKVSWGEKDLINTAGVDDAISRIDKWVGAPNKDPISLDKYKGEYKDISDYYNKGYDKGSAWGDKFGNMFGGLGTDTDTLLDQYDKSTIPYEPGDLDVSGNELPKDLMDGIDKIKNNTGETADNTSITKEDLKYLIDLAEQRVINRFTTAEIKITNHMNNNINTDRDLDGVVNYISEEIVKGANIAAESTHY